MKKTLLFSIFALSLCSYSQNESATEISIGDSTFTELDLFSLSLEDLMNLKIISASRSEETVFQSPTSSCVITSSEILNNGFATIAEALRLCPGVMVRELTNGTFDVTIRDAGFGLPRYQSTVTNKNILVMIDNRPVFSYFEGGTFWQNLPIEINEVERIEVVYGPSSALYGPNAVQGVINLISKKGFENKKTTITSTIQGGSNTKLASVFAGAGVNDKVSVSFGASFADRDRYQTTFYDSDPSAKRFVDSPTQFVSPTSSVKNNPLGFFPYPNKAMRKSTANASATYKAKSDIILNASFGFNENYFNNQYFTGTTLTPFSGQSYYGYTWGSIKGLSYQISHLSGRQNIVGALDNYNHNFSNTDVYVDYDLKVNDKISLKPAVSSSIAEVDDRPYSVNKGLNGAFNNRGVLENYAFSLRAEFKTEKIRLIASGRGDAFSKPNTIVPSYNLVANYFITTNHMIRANIGKSYNSSFIIPTYINISLAGGRVINRGNTNLNLTNMQTYELGYRSQFNKKIGLDISVFRNEMSDFYGIIRDSAVSAPPPLFSISYNSFGNLNDKLTQNGITLALNATLFKNIISVRSFVTIQRSDLANSSDFVQRPSNNPTKNLNIGSDFEYHGSPNSFGGVSINAKPNKRLNINLNSFYFGEHHLTSSLQTTTQFANPANPTLPVQHNISNIKPKVIMNAKVSYKVVQNTDLFVNLRNFNNATSRESLGTDVIGPLYLVGGSLTF